MRCFLHHKMRTTAETKSKPRYIPYTHEIDTVSRLQAYLLWVRVSSSSSRGLQFYSHWPIILNVHLHVGTKLAI